MTVTQIINSVETLKRHQCPFPWIPPPGNAKPWDRMCGCAVILKGESIEPWLITMLMRENWWLTKGRETIWIKTKLPLKGNSIPIAQMQEEGIVWHCECKHDLSFFSMWTSPGKMSSVLRTAPGTGWHFSPHSDWWTGSSLPGWAAFEPLNLCQGQEYWGERRDFGPNPGWIQHRSFPSLRGWSSWWSLWGHSHLWKTRRSLTYCAKSTASYWSTSLN